MKIPINKIYILPFIMACEDVLFKIIPFSISCLCSLVALWRPSVNGQGELAQALKRLVNTTCLGVRPLFFIWWIRMTWLLHLSLFSITHQFNVIFINMISNLFRSNNLADLFFLKLNRYIISTAQNKKGLKLVKY